MGFIENSFVRSDLKDAGMISRWGGNQVSRLSLSQAERDLHMLYLKGYLLVQGASYFEGFKRLPYYYILGKIPPVPQVVNAAELSARIGREILDETACLQSIFEAGKQEKLKNVRGLANLMSSVITWYSDTYGAPERKLAFEKIKLKLEAVVEKWQNSN